jgi:DNA-binding transcriptional MerR regulator
MTAIPNRAVFRSQEVCEIADVQLYVLRTWEAEFPDLGLSKSAGAPRVYRRGDVERVLRLKHLLFVEGLTLAGARRQLSEEDPAMEPAVDDDTVPDAEVAALMDREVMTSLRDVKSGLHWILGVLNGGAAGAGPIRLVPARSQRHAPKKPAKPSRPTKTARAAKPSRAARTSRPSRLARKSAAKRKR